MESLVHIRPRRVAHAMRMLTALYTLVLVAMTFYGCVRLMGAARATERTVDFVAALVLLAADMFLIVHGLGFTLSVVRALRDKDSRMKAFAPTTAVPVAVLVTSFNESEEVLEQTLASTRVVDYPAMNIYLVDDSTKEESQAGARRLAEKYGATLVHRTNRAGYKAGAINDLLPTLSEPYFAVLDADQRPSASWLAEVVPLLEADPRLAFVQVPQVYANLEGLPVARTTRFQQAVFFEHICEGKSAANAMFCCGSNVVLRREALLSIEQVVDGRRHFFDETSVTEDFATSLRLHLAGWKTLYKNVTFVVGMGPETLAAYFTQQMRWAMGTLGIGKRLFSEFLRHPRGLSPAQWWEYSLSGTYYFVGMVNFVFLLAPFSFTAFGVRPLRVDPGAYVYVFVPYVVTSATFFFLGMWLRGYPLRELWLATVLNFVTFWTYTKASLVAIFGLKRAFGVTPKGVGGALPLRSLKVELTMLVLNLIACAQGLFHLATVNGGDIGYLANTFWAGYHALLLTVLFVHFNRRVDLVGRRLLFEAAELSA
jgi:cellulose synthase (UDP-forming)